MLCTYLLYNTVVWLCQFFCCGGKVNFVGIPYSHDRFSKMSRTFARLSLRPEKISSSRLSGGCPILITTGKKSSSRLSGGCAIVITTRKKSSSCLSGGCAIVVTVGKKKFYSSVWRVHDRYYDRKKKVLVVCWAQQVIFSSEFAPLHPHLSIDQKSDDEKII